MLTIFYRFYAMFRVFMQILHNQHRHFEWKWDGKWYVNIVKWKLTTITPIWQHNTTT